MRSTPLLEKEEEFKLAKQWKEEKDAQAVEKLVESHLKLVNKIASGYRGYGLPLSDLISEGNVGMMLALQTYDHSKGFRLSTYAQFWIKAAITEYIYNSWSLVRKSKSPAARKLFFNLRSEHAKMHQEEESHVLTDEQIKSIATKLQVKEAEVKEMYIHLQGRESSLNTAVGESSDSSTEWIDWVEDHRQTPEQEAIENNEIQYRLNLLHEGMKALKKKELEILQKRRLKEPPETLHDLAEEYAMTPEGIRQIELRAFEKVKNYSQLHHQQATLSKK